MTHTTRPEKCLNKLMSVVKYPLYSTPVLIHVIGKQELVQSISIIARSNLRSFTMESNFFVCLVSLTNTLRYEKSE